MKLPVFNVVVLICAVSGQAQQFQEIANVPQDTVAVNIPPICPTNGTALLPMFTIEPSSTNETTVSTYPKDLVTARSEGGTLILTYNIGVAYGSSEGGVRIKYPPGQLEAISTCASQMTQILGGFTRVERLEATSSTTLYANLSSLSDSKYLNVHVSSSGLATIVSGAPVGELSVTTSGRCFLQAPRVDRLSASSSGTFLNGNLSEGEISSSAVVFVDGIITGSVNISSSGRVSALQVTGQVSGSSGGILTANTCDTFSGDSESFCYIDEVQDVSVNIEALPLLSQGTQMCVSAPGGSHEGSPGGPPVGTPGGSIGLFEELSSVPQGTVRVRIPPTCAVTGFVALPMFTLVPTSTVGTTVSTHPKNLVTARNEGETLVLTFNETVAYNAKESGVLIAYPAAQLEAVSTADSQMTQILGGFTNVRRLEVTSKTKLFANLSSLSDSGSLDVKVSTSGSATIISGAPLSEISVSSFGRCALQAPRVDLVSASTSGSLVLNGNLVDGDVSSSADVSVNGTISGSVTISSSGAVAAAQVLGQVSGSSGGTLTADTCVTFSESSGASCHLGGVQDVTVDVEVQPFVRNGVYMCWSAAGFAQGGISAFGILSPTILIVSMLLFH